MKSAALMGYPRRFLPCARRQFCSGNKLTHLDASGRASMVNVGSKPATIRTAKAGATVIVGEKVFNLLNSSLSSKDASKPQSAKGDVFTVAQLAGIMAAKRTSSLIPLCHDVPLAHVGVELSLEAERHEVNIIATASTRPTETGVEMEALTAASVAALTVYDMCKAAGKEMVVTDIRLLEKSGGRSGDWRSDREEISE